MEKQLNQFLNNVKAFCRHLALLLVAISFACATLITVGGESAKNVLAFQPFRLSESTQENAEYILGDVKIKDYASIQNNLMVAAALDSAGEVEPQTAELEEKETEVVATSYVGASAAPVYADPSSNGYEYIGTYLTTGYCACAQCCGKSNGITASGSIATANHTIAADTSVLPFGTQVVINGKVYTVEDRGSAIRGGRIDIYFSTHQEALNYGKRYVTVYRYVGVSENASPIAEELSSDATVLVEAEVSTESSSVEATTETAAASETTTESSTDSSVHE